MNINSSNLGIGTGLVQASGEPVPASAPETQAKPGILSGRSVKIVTQHVPGQIEAPVTEAVNRSLHRNDAIGNLFSRAFKVS